MCKRLSLSELFNSISISDREISRRTGQAVVVAGCNAGWRTAKGDGDEEQPKTSAKTIVERATPTGQGLAKESNTGLPQKNTLYAVPNYSEYLACLRSSRLSMSWQKSGAQRGRKSQVANADVLESIRLFTLSDCTLRYEPRTKPARQGASGVQEPVLLSRPTPRQMNLLCGF
jgi:hypothetical protein